MASGLPIVRFQVSHTAARSAGSANGSRPIAVSGCAHAPREQCEVAARQARRCRPGIQGRRVANGDVRAGASSATVRDSSKVPTPVSTGSVTIWSPSASWTGGAPGATSKPSRTSGSRPGSGSIPSRSRISLNGSAACCFGLRTPLLDGADRGRERGRRVELGAQRHEIAAIRDETIAGERSRDVARQPDDHVAGRGMATDHDEERRQQHVLDGDVQRGGHGAHAVGQALRQWLVDALARQVEDSRARPVARQLGVLPAGQCALPERGGRVGIFALGPLALPARVLARCAHGPGERRLLSGHPRAAYATARSAASTRLDPGPMTRWCVITSSSCVISPWRSSRKRTGGSTFTSNPRRSSSLTIS